MGPLFVNLGNQALLPSGGFLSYVRLMGYSIILRQKMSVKNALHFPLQVQIKVRMFGTHWKILETHMFAYNIFSSGFFESCQEGMSLSAELCTQESRD